MADATYVTECWVDHKLFDPAEFKKAFEAHLEGSEAQEQQLAPDFRPGHSLFHLLAPIGIKEEVFAFLDKYAASRGGVNIKEPSSTYPFAKDA